MRCVGTFPFSSYELCKQRKDEGKEHQRVFYNIYHFLRCVARVERRDGVFEVMKRLTFAMKSPSS